MVWCGVLWCDTVVWSGAVWCGLVWVGSIWCSAVWYFDIDPRHLRLRSSTDGQSRACLSTDYWFAPAMRTGLRCRVMAFLPRRSSSCGRRSCGGQYLRPLPESNRGALYSGESTTYYDIAVVRAQAPQYNQPASDRSCVCRASLVAVWLCPGRRRLLEAHALFRG